MKPPIHSPASIKAHPVTSMTATGMSPSEILDAIGIDKLCDQIANAEYYQDIADKSGVSRGFLMKYLSGHEALYAHAREARGEKMAEEILKIADDGSNDTYVIAGDDGNPDQERTNHDVIARSRLRVDSRKWLASKMFPKRYGDKLAIGGADDMPPIQTISADMTPQDAARAYAEMVAGKK